MGGPSKNGSTSRALGLSFGQLYVRTCLCCTYFKIPYRGCGRDIYTNLRYGCVICLEFTYSVVPLCFCAKRIAFYFAGCYSLPSFNSGPEFFVDAFPKRGCVPPRILVVVVFPLACCSYIILSMPSVTFSLIKFDRPSSRAECALDEEEEG